MNEIKLKSCPMCGSHARFEYGGAMDSGKQIVKVRCAIGCIEQVIFHCEEVDAAKSWNSRSIDPFAAALDALSYYQRNWDTGLVSPYAESERVAMECAVEAVRDALNDAREAS